MTPPRDRRWLGRVGRRRASLGQSRLGARSLVQVVLRRDGCHHHGLPHIGLRRDWGRIFGSATDLDKVFCGRLQVRFLGGRGLRSRQQRETRSITEESARSRVARSGKVWLGLSGWLELSGWLGLSGWLNERVSTSQARMLRLTHFQLSLCRPGVSFSVAAIVDLRSLPLRRARRCLNSPRCLAQLAATTLGAAARHDVEVEKERSCLERRSGRSR
jgi:hypothetical protein